MKTRIALANLILLLILPCCGPEASKSSLTSSVQITGRYKQTDGDSLVTTVYVWDFLPGGTVTRTGTSTFYGGETMGHNGRGTYQITGHTLTATLADVEMKFVFDIEANGDLTSSSTMPLKKPIHLRKLVVGASTPAESTDGNRTAPSAKQPEERAKNAAKNLVLKNLAAPSTASFPEVRILYKRPPWYQLYVIVDGQNSRQGYVCTIKDDGETFSYTPVAGIQQLDESAVALPGILEGIRAASGWPGADK